jgi:DNA-binding FadR family transcriptional regulator
MVERNEAQSQLKELIDAGEYAPGDRLPAERVLIEQLGISRTALRKGLEALEREGVIWRHVGKGTFVAANDTTPGFTQLAELSYQVTPVQMMRARIALEPSIAREAAANASSQAVARLHAAHQRAMAAVSWDSYETDDDEFHRSVAQASGNVLLLSLLDHLNQVRRAVTWRQVIRHTEKPPASHSSFTEHDQIVAAIEARDPIAAHDAMRDHLRSVSNRLFGDV